MRPSTAACPTCWAMATKEFKCVRWGKICFVVGPIEQPRLNKKISFTGTTSPTNQPRNHPFIGTSWVYLTSVSTVSSFLQRTKRQATQHGCLPISGRWGQGRTKISCPGTTGPTNQLRKGPLHLYSLSPHSPQFQQLCNQSSKGLINLQSTLVLLLVLSEGLFCFCL